MDSITFNNKIYINFLFEVTFIAIYIFAIKDEVNCRKP